MRAGALVAALLFLAVATPAQACRFSRPVVAAQPSRVNGVEVEIAVDGVLWITGRVAAVRAAVVRDSDVARRGERVVIIVSTEQPEDCYYAGFADPRTVGRDGSLRGFVDVVARREASGAFSAVVARPVDRSRYDRFVQGTLPGRWMPARFGRGENGGFDVRPTANGTKP